MQQLNDDNLLMNNIDENESISSNRQIIRPEFSYFMNDELK